MGYYCSKALYPISTYTLLYIQRSTKLTRPYIQCVFTVGFSKSIMALQELKTPSKSVAHVDKIGKHCISYTEWFLSALSSCWTFLLLPLKPLCCIWLEEINVCPGSPSQQQLCWCEVPVVLWGVILYANRTLASLAVKFPDFSFFRLSLPSTLLVLPAHLTLGGMVQRSGGECHYSSGNVRILG